MNYPKGLVNDSGREFCSFRGKLLQTSDRSKNYIGNEQPQQWLFSNILYFSEKISTLVILFQVASLKNVS